MDDKEIRLRCIEAAAKAPMVHADGPAAGVVATAERWYAFVIRWTEWPTGESKARETLHLPKK